MKNRAKQRIELGQYIVADPEICHGKPMFKGTRIFVADVLADVERGLSWDFINGQLVRPFDVIKRLCAHSSVARRTGVEKSPLLADDADRNTREH